MDPSLSPQGHERRRVTTGPTLGHRNERKSHSHMNWKLVKDAIRRCAILIVPLSLRKWMAVWLNRRLFIGSETRNSLAEQLLSDFAGNDVNEYHRFMWTHHLGYAETYVVEKRFGYENMHETRKIFFEELRTQCASVGLDPATDFASVFEAGCSLGYLLRHMETDVFTSATGLEGVDIDGQAIAAGTQHLAKLESRVVLHEGNMESMADLLNDRTFDFMLASGVLLYLDQPLATKLVAQMIRHTEKMLAITALAHPTIDNKCLSHSVLRERDSTWIHNVDEMILQAGGTVYGRRCDTGRIIDQNTVYFLFAMPPNLSKADRVQSASARRPV